MIVAIALASALGVGPEPVDAAPIVLRWTGPDACPGEDDVRAAIEQHLGASLASPRGDGLVVDATAKARADGRWDVDLVVESSEGRSQRTIGSASDCPAAAEAAALVIAIAIDPDLALRDEAGAKIPPPAVDVPPVATTGTPTTSTSTSTTTSTATSTSTSTSVRSRGRRPRLRGAISALFDATFGTMPRVGLGGSGFVDLLIGTRGRVGLGGSFGGAPPLAVDGATIRMLRWTIEARGCPVFGVRRWLEIVPCVGFEAGRTRVDTRGLVDPKNPRETWAAPTALVATVFVPRPAFAVWVGLHGLVPLLPRRYEIAGAPSPYKTAHVAGGVVVGIEARFP